MKLHRYALWACLAVTLMGCPDDAPGTSPLLDIGPDAVTDVAGDGTVTVEDTTADTTPEVTLDTQPGDGTATDTDTRDATDTADTTTQGDAQGGDTDTADTSSDVEPDAPVDTDVGAPDAIGGSDSATDSETVPDSVVEDTVADASTDTETSTPDGDVASDADAAAETDATTVSDTSTGDAGSETTGADSDDGTTGDDGGASGDDSGPDAPPTGCAAEGEDCVLSVFAGVGFTCVDDHDQDSDGVCRVSCMVPTQIQDCGGNAVCVAPDGTDSGFCVPDSCSGFFADDCGAGAWCQFIGDAGQCLVAGPGVTSDPCTGPSDCQAGLICLADTCQPPECSADGTTVPCGSGLTCAPFLAGPDQIDFGECVEFCAPFEADACPVGEFCEWEAVNDFTGELRGSCTPAAGTASLGADCSVDPCLSGLVCVDADDDGTPECNAICNPAAASAADPGFCGIAGELCLPLIDPDSLQILFFGYCSSACPTFQDPDPCPTGQWCLPNASGPTTGQCVDDTGTAAAGEACGPGTECVGGTTCVDGECETLCLASALPGAPGSCGPGADCVEVPIGGSLAGQGICMGTCDVHANQSCTDPGEVCVLGELNPTGGDACLALDPALTAPVPIGADCPPGAEIAGFCNDSALCFPVGPGAVTCTQTCVATEGAIPGFGNPADCIGGTVCIDISLGSNVGLCGVL